MPRNLCFVYMGALRVRMVSLSTFLLYFCLRILTHCKISVLLESVKSVLWTTFDSTLVEVISFMNSDIFVPCN